MALKELSADEFVQHAVFLFGAQWRDSLAAELGVSRKSLVLQLASGEKLPADMTLAILRLLEDKLEDMQHEQALLRDRISALGCGSGVCPAPVVQVRSALQHAC